MKRYTCAFCAFLILICCAGCGNNSGIKTRDDVEGKTIGILEGTSSELYGKLHGTVIPYDDKRDLLDALKANEIDCIVADEHDVNNITRFQFFLTTLDEPLAVSKFRIAAAKENPDLIDDVNSAILALTENGVLDKIVEGYYNDKNYRYEPAEVSTDAKTLTAVVGGDFMPYKYTGEDGELCGIDIDVAKAICSWLGYNVEFHVVDGNSLISDVQNGYAHFAIGGITSNTDTDSNCIMSEPYSVCTQMIIVR